MLRFVCLFFLAFYYEAAFAKSYLAFLNKSYSADLNNSMRLFESFDKHVVPKTIPYYMVVPSKEVRLFKEKFAQLRASKQLTSEPIFVSEEQVLYECGFDSERAAKSGWHLQQVIKLCFAKTKYAENYFSLDSDTVFTREFDANNILFKNGRAKTFAPRILKSNNKERFFRRAEHFKNFEKIKMLVGDKTENYNYFVAGYAMWSSKLVKDMERFFIEQHKLDMIDLINLVPYEMQWYGEYVYNNKRALFFPLRPLFTLVEDKFMRSCPPTDGFPWDFGVLYNNVKSNQYKNQCGPIKTFFKVNEKRIERWIRMLKGQNV